MQNLLNQILIFDALETDDSACAAEVSLLLSTLYHKITISGFKRTAFIKVLAKTFNTKPQYEHYT